MPTFVSATSTLTGDVYSIDVCSVVGTQVTTGNSGKMLRVFLSGGGVMECLVADPCKFDARIKAVIEADSRSAWDIQKQRDSCGNMM